MKRSIIFFITIFIGSLLFAQNAPYVYNVSGTQRTDGSKIVDIYYNVLEPDADTLFVSLQVSADDGATFAIIPADSLLSGDIDWGVLSGNDKHIIWQAGEEETLTFEGTTYKFKVIADDDPFYSLFEWCNVPAGDYTYGDPPQTLNIDHDYEIMQYEVTNQQYVDYLQEAGDVTVTTSTVEGYYEGDENYGAGTYEFLDMSDSDCRINWDGSNFTIISGYEDHPVVEVTWFGSWAFAEHYGLRLPTEHEWEKAARGNTGYDYPWGNSIDGSRANYYNSGDPWDNGTTPVGMYNGQTIQGFSTTDSPSPYGAYDMAGNVWNWTDSWWSDTSSARVRRGGGWSYYTGHLLSWYRYSGNPAYSHYNFGFRCVRP